MTCIALHEISELRSVTCHTRSHSVTSHPTQVNAPRLNPSHAGRYSFYLPRRDGRLSWPCYSETQPAAGSRTRDLSVPNPTPLPCKSVFLQICLKLADVNQSQKLFCCIVI